MIEECFVTHTDARFLPLSEVLVKGLQHFSSRPIIVYGVDTEIGYDSPNLIKRRLHSKPGQHIAYLKLRAILETDARRGIYLDADNVPNQGIDRLFDLSRPFCEYPLLPRHPHDLGAHLHGELMKELGVGAKLLPYLHSCCVAFSPRCRAFIEECYAVSRRFDRRRSHPLVVDESIINVMLWKAGARRYLESCNIDQKFYDCYLQGSWGCNPEFQQLYGQWPFRFLTFHYCKDPSRAEHMLQGLIGAHGEGLPPEQAGTGGAVS